MSVPTQALADYILRMADDELLLAHRDSEWTGHAPILEEDIAFTNIALDEMGHAAVWYALHAELMKEQADAHSDRLVFQRSPEAFLCTSMVVLPNGDWAFSMLRQYLFDVAEKVRLESLASSGYAPIAHAAAKLRPEEAYHERHTRAWVLRLGEGTQESNRRMQHALDRLWGHALGLFGEEPAAAPAIQAGWIPQGGIVRQRWQAEVSDTLAQAGLRIPAVTDPPTSNRRQRDEYLSDLLDELQSVARSDPMAVW
jgi:ring-1,2-phenylacetyl-CoA epoxidase subunit PaaC